jgi:hypothetical protein
VAFVILRVVLARFERQVRTLVRGGFSSGTTRVAAEIRRSFVLAPECGPATVFGLGIVWARFSRATQSA